MEKNDIRIRGAKANNLKSLNIDIPRDTFIVVTGLSGSGKSSLAFDTIYAEGQRRYVESLSSYARQFIDLMDRPEADIIEGLPPAIAIDQKGGAHNPRSTVGTVTEIYDFWRLLFSKIGIPHCPNCGSKMKPLKQSELHKHACEKCDYKMPELTPNYFSFNSSHGACPKCAGLGTKLEVDPELILNYNLTIPQGAIKPWTHYNLTNQKNLTTELETYLSSQGADINQPLKSFSTKLINSFLSGNQSYSGVIPALEKKYEETDSGYIRQKIGQYLRALTCPQCHGSRLKPEILAVKINGLSIFDVSEKNLADLKKFAESLLDGQFKISVRDRQIVEPIIKEILSRLEAITNVGLNYLSLNRATATLSGGEFQRIRLASQINSSLVNVLYVLDEPSIGLHQKDNDKLIKTLKSLKSKGNTVIVVEHDEAMMLSADQIIDIGPGAGEHGGRLVFQGTPEEIKKCPTSLTGQYLSGSKIIPTPLSFREGNGQSLKINGATEHNLRNINVNIPLGKLVAITGVSGSGKSTLVSDILAKALNKKFYRAKDLPGAHKNIEGIENIDKVIDIDQSPIGRTPRSNPATYTGLFSPIRDLFASLPESKVKGFKASHFSFNVPGGRCENCGGDGMIKIEMQFLSDIYVKCDVCEGRRYQNEILEIKYHGQSILDVLNMTVDEALNTFKTNTQIQSKLKILRDVGLGYIRLGQSATTLSGGEAQRIKLASELSRQATGKTFYILDEPTTGLHFEDIKRLLEVLNRLVDKGNTVLIVEHNLDVIKSVDWIIDLGPDGGNEGGEIVVAGTPREVAKSGKGWTAEYLKDFLRKHK